jgi:hypothetical protein
MRVGPQLLMMRLQNNTPRLDLFSHSASLALLQPPLNILHLCEYSHKDNQHKQQAS